jgi:hypothetical protein
MTTHNNVCGVFFFSSLTLLHSMFSITYKSTT